jgi:RsiW-degrading membrane proteinase PrsW (M82 family)
VNPERGGRRRAGPHRSEPPPPLVGVGEEVAAEPALAWRGDLPAPRTALRERWEATPPARRWAAVALAAVLSGPFAIVAAFYENSTAGVGFLLLVVVFAPLVEESVKGMGALVLAELRPWLVPAAWVLPVITVVAGLQFAAIENWWYLAVLIEDPSPDIVRWRWILGPLVHGTCSLVVGLGTARMWRRAWRNQAVPDFADARGFVVAAAVLHGAFNLGAVLFGPS